MGSMSNGLQPQDTTVLSQIEEVAHHLLEVSGPGAVRVLFSDASETFYRTCSLQTPGDVCTGPIEPKLSDINPVQSCPLLSQGMWSVLSQSGESPVDNVDVLCVASSWEGLGKLAVQVEVARFARKDFRHRRSICRSLLFGLLSVGSLMEGQRLRDRVKEMEEQAHNLIRSHALAREMERERLSVQMHDGVIQGLISVTLMVEALREMADQEPEQAALLEKSEDLLRRSIRETRGVINALHSGSSGAKSGE